MRTLNRKDVLTTGDVARICHVAPRTVTKWFDTGKLRGYRIPGSRDRRIPRQQLLAFMRAHGMPTEGLDGSSCRVLLIDSQEPQEVIDSLNQSHRYDVRWAANGFEAGVLADQFRPHVIVLEAWRADEAVAICRNIKQTHDLSATKVLASVEGLDGQKVRTLLAAGFDGCLSRPYSPQQLARAVEEATSLVT